MGNTKKGEHTFAGVWLPVPVSEIHHVRAGWIRVKKRGKSTRVACLHLVTTGGRRHRISNNVGSLQRAEGVARALLERMAEGSIDSMSLRLADATKRYLESLERGRRRKSTLAKYSASLTGFENYLSDAITLSQIKEIDIYGYQEMRLGQGRDERTVRNNLCDLRSFFRWCVRRGYLARNPFPEFRNLAIPRQKKIYRVLEPKEFGVLVQACELWLRDIVTFAFLTMLRKGEIIALSWSWISEKPPTITVLEEKITRRSEPKSIPLHPICREILTRRREETGGEDPVFRGRQGRPLTTHLQEYVRAAAVKAGLDRPEEIGFHTLRRTADTGLIRIHTDVRTLQDLMRHSSAEMAVALYGQSNQGLQLHALSGLWQLFGNYGVDEGADGSQVIEFPGVREGQ